MSSIVPSISLCVAVLALLPQGYSQPHGIDSCPPWFQYNGSYCVCGDTNKTGGIVTCNETLQMSYLLLDYCMTYDNVINETILFYCPYDTSKHKNHTQVKQSRQMVLNTTVSKLISFFCGPLKRQGPYCEQCMKNHGPSVFTENLKCINCDKTYSGWTFYLTLEFFPLTVFFLVIVLTGISPCSGSMNSFVMLSQLFSLLFSYGNQDQLVPPYGEAVHVIVQLIRTSYGFWNLDFFRGLVGNFCVSSHLTNLQAISLHLIPPFYPVILLIVASGLIYLYHRNFRPFVRAWKPFKKCLSHYPLPNDLRCSIIRLFVTFYLFGYTKILSTCTLLLVRGSLFKLNSSEKTSVLLMSPDIEYFSTNHTGYAVISLILLILTIFIPAVYLTIHPLLEKKCNGFTRITFITITVDAFSSCFKDGQDGQMDCRHFAGAYLLLRVIAVMLFSVIWSPLATYLTITGVFFLATVTVGVCRPYKQKLHNVLDIVFFSLLTIGILFASLANFLVLSDSVQIFFTVIVLFSFLIPLLYALLYISYHLIKLVILLVSCSCKKRRQYEEITQYEDSASISNEHSANNSDAHNK